MPTRTIDRELRLQTAIEALGRFRSRAARAPEALTQRQGKDRRKIRVVDSTVAANLLATIDTISSGAGVAAAAAAGSGSSSGGGYYNPGGGGGGGDIQWNAL